MPSPDSNGGEDRQVPVTPSVPQEKARHPFWLDGGYPDKCFCPSEAKGHKV